MEGFFITARLKIFLAKIKLAIYYANMACRYFWRFLWI